MNSVRALAHFCVGSSGFAYKHWKGVFYPEGVAQARWLEYYASQFDTLELNNTFYSMPRAGVCESWRRRTPEGFVAAVKMNRLVTHRKFLDGTESLVQNFLDAVNRLGPRLGPILVQLPPNRHADPERLARFLGHCPSRYRWAVEFRDARWLCNEVFETLAAHHAALVVHDLIEGHPDIATAGWVYRRYHGTAGKYTGRYSRQKLRAEADATIAHLREGRDVYAYFNNDAHGYAVENARTLRRHVEENR